MNLLLFIIAIIVSFIIVRIGAIAFELTGLEWSLAKFQALSCFTGTGFTTKEAELITGNPQRRRIASVLMVLGSAGFVTMIATFANSLRPNILFPRITVPFIDLVFPSFLLPWINLVIIIVSIYIIYRIFTRSKFTRRLTEVLRAKIVKQEIIKPVSFEELLVATGGYGVSSIEIHQNNPILNKTLSESELRNYDITVLAIERGEQIIANPSAETKVILKDKLVCFGKLENIRKELALEAK